MGHWLILNFGRKWFTNQLKCKLSQLFFQHNIFLVVMGPAPRQRTHDVKITLLWRQNDAATSFWRHNDVNIAPCVRAPPPFFFLLQYCIRDIYNIVINKNAYLKYIEFESVYAVIIAYIHTMKNDCSWWCVILVSNHLKFQSLSMIIYYRSNHPRAPISLNINVTFLL